MIPPLLVARLFVLAGPAARHALRVIAPTHRFDAPKLDPYQVPGYLRWAPTQDEIHQANLARVAAELRGEDPEEFPTAEDLAVARVERQDLERLRRRETVSRSGLYAWQVDAAEAVAARFGAKLLDPRMGMSVVLATHAGWNIARRFIPKRLAPEVPAKSPTLAMPDLSPIAPHARDHDPGGVPDGGATWSRSHAKRFQPDHGVKLAQGEGWEEKLAIVGASPPQPAREVQRVHDTRAVVTREVPKPRAMPNFSAFGAMLTPKQRVDTQWSMLKGQMRAAREAEEVARLKAEARAHKMGVGGRIVNAADTK